MAVWSTITWLRNPSKNGNEVEIQKLNRKHIVGLSVFSVAVTAAFYYILHVLDTPNIVLSTISVTTSFLAASLTMLRSSYYALGYAMNDIVLIVLWIISSIADPAYISIVICFTMFFFNDIYGFVNWQRLYKRQNAD